jgi:hypothetical protein
MKEDSIIELLITKFHSANKKEQNKLLSNLFSQTSHHDQIYDALNGRPLMSSDKNIVENEYAFIQLNASIYPNFNKDYYINNNLVIDDCIRVFVEEITIANSQIKIRAFFSNDEKETTTTTWSSYFVDKNKINFL